MPIYEYECSGCGTIEEVIQRFSDAPVTECRQCHGELHKLISHSTFHLKGSGWYVTDYAGKSEKSAAAAKPDDSPAAPQESKSDSAASTSKSDSE